MWRKISVNLQAMSIIFFILHSLLPKPKCEFLNRGCTCLQTCNRTNRCCAQIHVSIVLVNIFMFVDFLSCEKNSFLLFVFDSIIKIVSLNFVSDACPTIGYQDSAHWLWCRKPMANTIEKMANYGTY